MAVTYPQIGYEARAIEDAIHSWLAETSGVGDDRTWWANNDVTEVEYPFAVMNWIAQVPIGLPSFGVEVLIPDAQLIGTNDPRPDVRLFAGQIMEVTLNVQVFAHQKMAPEGSAMRRLSAAITLLNTGYRDTLNAAGLAILSIGGITQPDRDQASCDLRCAIATNVYRDITSIQSVRFGGDVGEIEIPETTIVNPEIGSLSYNSSMNYDQIEFTYEG